MLFSKKTAERLLSESFDAYNKEIDSHNALMNCKHISDDPFCRTCRFKALKIKKDILDFLSCYVGNFTQIKQQLNNQLDSYDKLIVSLNHMIEDRKENIDDNTYETLTKSFNDAIRSINELKNSLRAEFKEIDNIKINF